MYVIEKNGEYVKDFSNGAKFTNNWNQVEKYLDKEFALVKAQEYEKSNGKGYSVVEI